LNPIQVCSGAPAAEETVPQSDQLLPVSRSASASSSLDPYYFGLQSPTDSPVPILSPFSQSATTPDQPLINEPITPARNPANIDRRGLVGVGELATPRWTRNERTSDTDESDLQSHFDIAVESLLPDLPDNAHDDEPDSPWTIEAVDGEISDKEEVCSPLTALIFAHPFLKGSSPTSSLEGPPESSLNRRREWGRGDPLPSHPQQLRCARVCQVRQIPSILSFHTCHRRRYPKSSPSVVTFKLLRSRSPSKKADFRRVRGGKSQFACFSAR